MASRKCISQWIRLPLQRPEQTQANGFVPAGTPRVTRQTSRSLPASQESTPKSASKQPQPRRGRPAAKTKLVLSGLDGNDDNDDFEVPATDTEPDLEELNRGKRRRTGRHSNIAVVIDPPSRRTSQVKTSTASSVSESPSSALLDTPPTSLSATSTRASSHVATALVDLTLKDSEDEDAIALSTTRKGKGVSKKTMAAAASSSSVATATELPRRTPRRQYHPVVRGLTLPKKSPPVLEEDSPEELTESELSEPDVSSDFELEFSDAEEGEVEELEEELKELEEEELEEFEVEEGEAEESDDPVTAAVQRAASATAAAAAAAAAAPPPRRRRGRGAKRLTRVCPPSSFAFILFLSSRDPFPSSLLTNNLPQCQMKKINRLTPPY